MSNYHGNSFYNLIAIRNIQYHSKNISSNTQTLDVSSIASGMYFAKITASNNDIIEVKKVIKK